MRRLTNLFFPDLVAKTAEHDPTVPTTVIDGYPFHTEVHGAESLPVLLIVHGGPGVDFRYLLPLKELSDRYRVVFYDQRSTGLSPRTGRSGQSIEQHLSDLDSVIRHFSPNAEVTLLGHSWGAMLASVYLARYPNRVLRALIIEPGILTPESCRDFVKEIKKQNSLSSLFSLFALLSKGFFASRRDGEEMGDYVMTKMMGSGSGAPYQCEGQALPPNSFWRAGYLSFKTIMMPAMKDPDLFPGNLTEGLRNYKGRVTLLSSECSFIGFDFQEKHHLRLFPQGTEHLKFEGGGHNFITIMPQESLKLLRSLL